MRTVLTPTAQINEIMDWFEFGRVAAAMNALDWRWASYPETPPPEPIIREEARKLLEGAFQGKRTIASGGFTATFNPETEDISLSFAIDEWVSEKVREE